MEVPDNKKKRASEALICTTFVCNEISDNEKKCDSWTDKGDEVMMAEREDVNPIDSVWNQGLVDWSG